MGNTDYENIILKLHPTGMILVKRDYQNILNLFY